MKCLGWWFGVIVLSTVFHLVSLKQLHPEKKSYEGYKIIQAKLKDEEQRWLIRELNENGQVRLLEPSDAVLLSSSETHVVVAVVPPQTWNSLETFLTEKGIIYDVLVQDFQKHIDSSIESEHRHLRISRGKRRKHRYAREVPPHSVSLGKYQTYAEIEEFLKNAERMNSKIMHLKVFGRSSEGRLLHAVHIDQKSTGNLVKSSRSKPVIIVDAGIHAREWITISSALCFIIHLATFYETNRFLQQFHWIIMPVINADGYEFSWKNDRLWRKTRSKAVHNNIPKGGPDCIGADPNRNWGIHWGEKGVQRYNACTEVYAGPHPFSEPEVAALSDVIEYYREKVTLHVSLHAFSQVILSPFGYKSGKTTDYVKQAAVMKAGADAIKATSGYMYSYGSIYDTMYAASGSSIDYIYEALDVKQTFVIELRDTGKFGFVLPQKEILPTCKEAIAAIIAMAEVAHKSV